MKDGAGPQQTFASRSAPVHLARGVLGFGLIAASIALIPAAGPAQNRTTVHGRTVPDARVTATHPSPSLAGLSGLTAVGTRIQDRPTAVEVLA